MKNNQDEAEQKELGEEFIKAREELGLTQLSLVEKAGMHVTYYA